MTCQLHFLTGSRMGTSVRFTQHKFWLGRDPRCELAFDPNADLTVSGRHLQFIRSGASYQINDSSTNGTFVNGQQVKQVVLNDGDILELGQGGPQLRFTLERPTVAYQQLGQEALLPKTAPTDMTSPSAAESSQLEQGISVEDTGPTNTSPGGASNMATGPTLAAEALATSRVYVTLQRLPSGKPREYSQQVIRIGRDPSADLAFDAQTELLVSYNHGKIMILNGQAVLFDSESTNGTYIDGERVNRRDLKSGDEIELGPGGPKVRVTIRSEELEGPQHVAKATKEVGLQTVFGSPIPEIQNLSLGDAALLREYSITDCLTIGRSESSSIMLDSMYVSNQHAVIEKRNGGIFLKDVGSANGTYMSGNRIADAQLTPGIEFMVGPYVLKFSGQAVLVFDTRTKTWVDGFELCRTDPHTKRNFLDRVSIKIQPGEFVCILGPSGCGKSTLLKSLNGLSPANSGAVFMNNIDFYSNYEQLKHQVGYVPQDDIIHPQLSIWRTLHYAAKLRLPPDTHAAKRKERIIDVLSALELMDHRYKPIHKLSGGQRKRVSIAVELLTDPAIIYLDEPTSGLDPNLEEKMMLLLREMTLRGKTVASVTHTLDNIQLADKVTFMVDGKMAFFGDADEAREYFGVERLPDVYKRFEERKNNTDSLRTEFEASPYFEKNIHSQLKERSPDASLEKPRRGKRIGPRAFKQFLIFTSRYTEIITRDMKNTTILLLQAPLVALFICLAVATDQPDLGPTSTMFLIMSLSALWFGCSNAAREITKETSIYARERMVNLKIVPYVLSKFFVLQWLALLQVGTMLTIVYFLRSGYTLAEPPPTCTRWGIEACSILILDGIPGDFWMHLLNLYLTALNGIGLGLLVSALAGNSDKAMSLVPLILIPQVLFSGSFGIPKTDELVKRSIGYAMSLNWSLDQSKRIAMCNPEQEKPKSKPGSGCTQCIHAYDPFKHIALKTEDQEEDARCKAIIPVMGQMTEFPEVLQVVEDGLYTLPGSHGKGEARDATRSSMGFFVLGGYTLILFILICFFMRLKDRKQR